MGQKINPISNRLGIVRGWDSNWFGGKNYGDTILEDQKIRDYLNARLAEASISRIVIERTLKLVTVTVCTARPGYIIGKGGQEVDKLKEELKKITKQDVQINIYEVKRPELDATIVAQKVAKQCAQIAFKNACMKAKPVLMEPIMKIEIVTPDENMGDVIGDLNKRRGQVEGMDTARTGARIVKAKVPLAEMFGYVTALRTITSGRATSSMEFSHYEPVSSAIAKAVLTECGGRADLV